MTPARTATLNIVTPEGVSFSLPLAGPVTRSLAFLIDLAALLAVFQLLSPLFSTLQLLGQDFGVGMTILIQFGFIEGSRMLMELLWQGRTLGKRVMGLRVVDESGLKLLPSQVVIRNLLRFVDILPLFYAVGGIVSLFNSKAQRLGDLAAGTVVVRNVRTEAPDIVGLLAGKYNSFRDHPHLEARLRQKVSAEEAHLALNALMRREELTAEARLKLYGELAGHFRGLVSFPEESVHGLSDEQYLRNVVETLFRPKKFVR